jgi:hypothetical protein
MKRIFVLLALSLILIGCEPGQELSLEALQNKTVVLSMHELKLEPLQLEDFFIGIKNEMPENATFYISAVCSNCENNIRIQTFPIFSMGPNKTAAIPIRVEVLEQSSAGSYTVKIIVQEDNRTYDSDEVRVEVPVTIEELKESILRNIVR